ncbi:hypothetical protein AGMMS49579_23240 [Spirochaetia bacterium]|nr:hypothetical protein AGMMS49579_23240 [Spirochaetia bacterium]
MYITLSYGTTKASHKARLPVELISDTDCEKIEIDRPLIDEFCHMIYDKLQSLFPDFDRTTKDFYHLVPPNKGLTKTLQNNPKSIPYDILFHKEMEAYEHDAKIMAPYGKSLFRECLNSWYFFDEVFNYDDIEKPWKQPPMRPYTEAEWAEELHRQEVELDKKRPKPITTEGKIAALEARIERIKHPPAKKTRGSGRHVALSKEQLDKIEADKKAKSDAKRVKAINKRLKELAKVQKKV